MIEKETYLTALKTIQEYDSQIKNENQLPLSLRLKEALDNISYKEHKIGDVYSIKNVNGKIDEGWKIAYYPLFGTYKGENNDKQWIDFEEPRALIEKKLETGSDFREMPLRYLTKILK